MSKNRNLVLVVEDDPGMLKGLQRLLRQYAYEPILFSSAQAFKSHTDFKKAVCVIPDINLNDGSGIEVRHHHESSEHFCAGHTGNDNAAVRTAALQSGCLAYLTKPFSAKSLMEPLHTAAAGFA